MLTVTDLIHALTELIGKAATDKRVIQALAGGKPYSLLQQRLYDVYQQELQVSTERQSP